MNQFSINLWPTLSIYKIFHFQKSINQFLIQCLAEVDNTITSLSTLSSETHQLENHVSFSGLPMISSMKTTWPPLALILDSKPSIPTPKISNCKSGIPLGNNDSEPSPTPTTKVSSLSIPGAHAVILVYDVTNLETFQSIENFWLNEVESYADPGAKLVLVGMSFLI